MTILGTHLDTFFFGRFTLSLSLCHQVNRQDIVGFSSESALSNYALLGKPGWINTKLSGLPSPHPDYFLAILWKQIVGRKVLSSTLTPLEGNGTSPVVVADIDIHMWCSTRRYHRSPVLTYLNVGSESQTIQVPSIKESNRRTEFFLTSAVLPSYEALFGDVSFLNGEQLRVKEDGSLYEFPLRGRRVGDDDNTKDQKEIIVPPYSYGFIVFHHDHVRACGQKQKHQKSASLTEGFDSAEIL